MSDPDILYIVLAYLVGINVITFFAFGLDKWKARHSRWRIPEATLLGLAAVGGSIGAWTGMHAWHHKTLHNKFRFGVPLILAIQIALVLLTSCASRQKAVLLDSANPIGHSFVPEHSPTVFLVMYDEKMGKEPLLKAINDYKAEIIYDYSSIPGMALRKPDDKSLEETMAYFRTVKGVVNVEYDHIIRLTDPVKPKLETK